MEPTEIKRAKMDDGDSPDTCPHEMGKIKAVEVLQNNLQDKFIAIKAKFEEDNAKTFSIILLEKTPFPSDEKSLLDAFQNQSSETTEVMQNDIYHKYSVSGLSEMNRLKMTVVHPATEKHLAKYTLSPRHLVLETRELYERVTLPYIRSSQFSLDWVENILEGRAETERCLLDVRDPDTGFNLAIDYKWDGKLLEDLYCLALVRRKDLMSLRDLRQGHLPLLRRIMEEGRCCIRDKYGLALSQQRVYVHYHPSFYHFHVHFTHANALQPGAIADRAHLMTELIANLELDDLYYAKQSLLVSISENTPLFGLLQAAGGIPL